MWVHVCVPARMRVCPPSQKGAWRRRHLRLTQRQHMLKKVCPLQIAWGKVSLRHPVLRVGGAWRCGWVGWFWPPMSNVVPERAASFFLAQNEVPNFFRIQRRPPRSGSHHTGRIARCGRPHLGRVPVGPSTPYTFWCLDISHFLGISCTHTDKVKPFPPKNLLACLLICWHTMWFSNSHTCNDALIPQMSLFYELLTFFLLSILFHELFEPIGFNLLNLW